MKIKASYRYQTYEYLKSITIYFVIILLYFLFTFYQVYRMKTLTTTPEQSTGFSMYATGLERFAAIFLCFIGYRAVNNLKLLSQNGTSRRSLMISQILSSFTFAFLMAFLCEVLLTLLKFWAKLYTGKIYISWTSYFEKAYEGSFQQLNLLSFHRLNFLLNFCSFLVILAFSYMVAVIYYHIARTPKIILNLVFLLYLFIIPNMFVWTNKSSLFNPWPAVDSFIVQTFQRDPLKLMITLLIIASLCHLTSYIMLRRTSLKA